MRVMTTKFDVFDIREKNELSTVSTKLNTKKLSQCDQGNKKKFRFAKKKLQKLTNSIKHIFFFF